MKSLSRFIYLESIGDAQFDLTTLLDNPGFTINFC